MAYSDLNSSFIKTLKFVSVAFFVVVTLFSCNNVDNFFLTTNYPVSFQLENGKFISSNRNKEHQLFSNSNAAYDWEFFTIVPKDNGTFYIKTSLDQYVSYNNKDSILVGNVNKAGKTETFKFKFVNGRNQLYTLNGGSIVVNEQNQLHVAYEKAPISIKTTRAIKYPASWFSLSAVHKLPFFVQLSVFTLLMILFFKRFKSLIKENRLSYYTILVLGFILMYVVLNTKQWQRDNVIVSDGIVYYEYLPAAFIFNDLTFQFTETLPPDFDGTIWVETVKETGIKVPKTSMGLSYMFSPFFFLGHATAKLTGFTSYGYSDPYGLFLCIGAWFYVFLALFYLRKILLFYFKDTVVAFTLISIVLATNLFYYTTLSATMSHAYSFCLFTIFIYQSIKWHETKHWKNALFVGLLMGLITLIRPTNALLAIVFILFNVTSFNTLKAKIILFWNYKIQLLLIVFAALIVWTPQLALWKYTTGHYFFFSYGEERFYFDNPHIFDGLFSYRKGWLVYTPIMVFALLGIVALFKIERKWALPIVIFTGLNIYIIYSWWCWWYGGSFGSRPMVDSYVLMAIPLAAFYTWLESKHHLLRYASIFIIILASALNLFQTQQTKTCLHWDGMTKEAYWNNFTTLGYPEGIDDMISPPDYKKAVKGIDEYGKSQ